MYWSQDVIISILFPYLLPSLPVCEQDCWIGKEFRFILQHLLKSLCNVSEIQSLLEIFVRRTFSDSSHKVNLDDDLCFLSNITSRSSFDRFYFDSEDRSLYACSVLIESKADIHANCMLFEQACRKGYTKIVALLLEKKIDANTSNLALAWACHNNQKDIASLLLQHKADVHAYSNSAIRLALSEDHKDIVNLLVKHKANINVDYSPYIFYRGMW
jgi:hypothetical protein